MLNVIHPSPVIPDQCDPLPQAETCVVEPPPDTSYVISPYHPPAVQMYYEPPPPQPVATGPEDNSGPAVTSVHCHSEETPTPTDHHHHEEPAPTTAHIEEDRSHESGVTDSGPGSPIRHGSPVRTPKGSPRRRVTPRPSPDDTHHERRPFSVLESVHKSEGSRDYTHYESFYAEPPMTARLDYIEPLYHLYNAKEFENKWTEYNNSRSPSPVEEDTETETDEESSTQVPNDDDDETPPAITNDAVNADTSSSDNSPMNQGTVISVDCDSGHVSCEDDVSPPVSD